MKIMEQIDLKIEDHITKYNEKHENLAIILGYLAFSKFKMELLYSGLIKTYFKGVPSKYKDCDLIVNIVYPETIEVARKLKVNKP